MPVSFLIARTVPSCKHNYYSNKKGSVQAVQGDANLDQIADVVHLLDTFFSGAPNACFV